MRAAQRAFYNSALEYAICEANRLKLPVLVCFAITPNYPEANLRHYRFMLEGLKSVETDLKKRSIPFVFNISEPHEYVLKLSKKAAMLVCDIGYTRIQRFWRAYINKHISVPIVELETEVIVPVRKALKKEAYNAKVLRDKLTPLLSKYLKPMRHRTLKNTKTNFEIEGFTSVDVKNIESKLNIDRTVVSSKYFSGGTYEAKKKLNNFINTKLDFYEDNKNDPSLNCVSDLSPYLHFGQISPLFIALEIKKAQSKGEKAFLEELIVRRELAINFVYYNFNYDKLEALPPWAIDSLIKHEKDKREYNYTLDEFEFSKTHDDYWNACQNELRNTGKMHGYLRMYWGKKIIEWSKSIKGAYNTALFLNNKYELDGRDPNAFAGVAWCFGKHDRPWKERAVFGTVRYMSYEGLKRKFDMDSYLKFDTTQYI